MGSDNESVSTLASESSVSEQTSRARQALLHKRLRDKDRQLSSKETELEQQRSQLDAKDRVVQELVESVNELRLQLTESETSARVHDTQHKTAELHAASQTQVISYVILIVTTTMLMAYYCQSAIYSVMADKVCYFMTVFKYFMFVSNIRESGVKCTVGTCQFTSVQYGPMTVKLNSMLFFVSDNVYEIFPIFCSHHE